jgi:uncharacterized damage-inducible protein DinB
MSLLTELLRGRGAHPDPVGAVADLTVQEAGLRAPGLPHSIWQLVSHLNFWMDAELRAIEGTKGVAERPITDWPVDAAPPDEMTWRHDLALFRLQLDQLATLADARASTLARIVHRAGDDRTDTVESVLWQLVAHNAYHTGQIVDVRRAVGLWPPRPGDA